MFSNQLLRLKVSSYNIDFSYKINLILLREITERISKIANN